MKQLTFAVILLSLTLSAAIFGFFYAWVCSTMWGLDAADPRVAIGAMQAMNASVRNAVFAPIFFGTPFALAATAAAVAGYPNLSLPGGFDSDLPLGLSLIGLPWSEQKLISAATFLEQKLQARKAPEFLSKAR